MFSNHIFYIYYHNSLQILSPLWPYPDCLINRFWNLSIFEIRNCQKCSSLVVHQRWYSACLGCKEGLFDMVYTDKKIIAWMYCKSLWIKASAKCINLHFKMWVSVAFLSSLTSLPILLWPLTSTRHFRPHNCRSLDIFSSSDHSL